MNNLLIYYGWPDNVGGLKGEELFGRYDFVVLGGGLEKESHQAHQGLKEILRHRNVEKTFFFGYVDLGVTTHHHSMDEVKRRVEEWHALGISHIFLDDFGYDFHTSRERQNEAVRYAHKHKMGVMACGWEPDDLFSPEVHREFNPRGQKTLLGKKDFYIYESYQVRMGEVSQHLLWREKMAKINRYRKKFKFKVVGVTTPGKEFSRRLYDYAYWSALMDELDALGWGEPLYGAKGEAVFREHPGDPGGKKFLSPVVREGRWYERRMDKGLIRVDPVKGEGFFIKDEG